MTRSKRAEEPVLMVVMIRILYNKVVLQGRGTPPISSAAAKITEGFRVEMLKFGERALMQAYASCTILVRDKVEIM